MSVVTRFAPSPTGYLHAGNYRTAIFAYLFAKKSNGKFILRIEDTDKDRSKKEFEENILETLAWLGLGYDGLYRQSDHVRRHKKALEELIAKGAAYVSKETPKETEEPARRSFSAGGRSEVIRFKNPNATVTFDDAVHGPITFDTTDLKDFVIGKSVEEPLFHFGVVVDDADENVTHIIRGEDHISNTPRQILIQRALGAQTPMYAHLPLVFGKDRAKLSKRRGAKALTEYRDEGYLPEAMTNYLALLGWNPGTEQELFSVQELVEAFSLERIQKSPAVFDEEKLRWFNREYLKWLDNKTFEEKLLPFLPESMKKGRTANSELFARLLPELRERVSIFSDLKTLADKGELNYYFTRPEVVVKSLKPPKKEGISNQATASRLDSVMKLTGLIPNSAFSIEAIKTAVFDYATKEGRAEVLWPMRYALSGKDKSPDPFTLAYILGKEETLERLKKAIAILKSGKTV